MLMRLPRRPRIAVVDLDLHFVPSLSFQESPLASISESEYAMGLSELCFPSGAGNFFQNFGS